MEVELQLKEQLARQLKRQMKQHPGEQIADDSDSPLDGMDQADIEDFKAGRDEWMASVLTKTNAQDFGKRFFGRDVNLRVLTLPRRGMSNLLKNSNRKYFEGLDKQRKGLHACLGHAKVLLKVILKEIGYLILPR